MSERATAYSIPPHALTTSADNELAVRPKVLRRPAHFNTKPIMAESPVPMLIPLQHTPQTAEKTAPPFRAWQDDGKFAITLLALVIIVNLVVSAWLAAISPATKPVATPASPAAAAPAATANAAVHVLDSNARDISEQ